jgi:molybdopterin-containing oxidoreductase family molybdopterin binding subunit
MAITEKAPQTVEDVWVNTACDMCYNGCSIQVHRVNGVAVKIEGIPDVAPNYGRTCAKGNAGLMNVYSPHRVKVPMVRTNPEKGIGIDPGWKEITWDEAMDLLVSKLRAAREKDPRSIAIATFDRYSFDLVRAFAGAFGTPNVTAGSAGFFCGNGVHPVAFTLTGSNDTHPDIHHTDYLLMFGTAYGFVAQANAIGLTEEMAQARARGMKLVVVDPVLSHAASQADEWIPIRPGTDTALALGIMREWVHELNHFDVDFLRKYTNATYLIGEDGKYVRDPDTNKPLMVDASGTVKPFDHVNPDDALLEVEGGWTEAVDRLARPSFAAFKEHLLPYTPEVVSEITSVPAETVRRIARDMAEAAGIGKTIRMGGHELPLRTAAALWYRGVSAHKHSLLNGMAIAQLNVLLGSVDVPGGILNASAAGPDWAPTPDPDGLMIPANPYLAHMKPPLPKRQVKQPQTLELMELFPVSVYARAMLWLGLLEGDKYGLPYKCEVLIQCRTNLMATGGDPQIMAEGFKTIPFVVSFNTFFDETTEMADLLLPDKHALERLVPLVLNPFHHYTSAARAMEPYTFNCQQPVVPTQGQARYWGEVLLDTADRLGILPEMYTALNHVAHLEHEYTLDPAGKYTWEEIVDRWTRSWFGDDVGLEYFKDKGYYKWKPRSIEATYPRAFHDARIPLYLEHFIGAGEAVRAFTRERQIDWNTEDYIPMVEWKPCFKPGEVPDEYDLYVVNQKLPFSTYSFTSENPWLVDLADRSHKVYTIGINPETAKKKGIKDGDKLVLETPHGRHAEGVARVTQGVHPECLVVPSISGRWGVGLKAAKKKGIHFNSLLTQTIERMDTVAAALDACVKVKVTKGGSE